MAEPTDSRAERYLRYSRRSMVAVLGLTVVIGSALLAVAVAPGGIVARWMPPFSAMLPIAITLVAGTLAATLRGDRWDPNAPEARVILEDEWRRANMNRAMRGAFVVVVAAQAPLGLWLSRLPASRGTLAMATATMTLGLAALAAFFLFFDREERDAG